MIDLCVIDCLGRALSSIGRRENVSQLSRVHHRVSNNSGIIRSEVLKLRATNDMNSSLLYTDSVGIVALVTTITGIHEVIASGGDIC